MRVHNLRSYSCLKIKTNVLKGFLDYNRHWLSDDIAHPQDSITLRIYQNTPKYICASYNTYTFFVCDIHINSKYDSCEYILRIIGIFMMFFYYIPIACQPLYILLYCTAKYTYVLNHVQTTKYNTYKRFIIIRNQAELYSCTVLDEI